MQHFTIFIGILYTAKHVEKSATATGRKRKQSSEEEQGRNKPYKILQCHHVIQECIIKKEGRKRYNFQIVGVVTAESSPTCTIIDLPVICPPTKYVLYSIARGQNAPAKQTLKFFRCYISFLFLLHVGDSACFYTKNGVIIASSSFLFYYPLLCDLAPCWICIVIHSSVLYFLLQVC